MLHPEKEYSKQLVGLRLLSLQSATSVRLHNRSECEEKVFVLNIIDSGLDGRLVLVSVCSVCSVCLFMFPFLDNPCYLLHSVCYSPIGGSLLAGWELIKKVVKACMLHCSVEGHGADFSVVPASHLGSASQGQKLSSTGLEDHAFFFTLVEKLSLAGC